MMKGHNMMKGQNMKVSIILPCLNVGSYISECIESAINQTLEDIELICVDAGSTDGTLETLREFERRDSRIKVVVSDKKSMGYQYNLGMDAASGEYIGFLEGDDYIPEEMYTELYDIAKANDVDFVKADFYRFMGEGETLSKALFKLSHNETDYNRVINLAQYQKPFRFVMNTWSGIYKRSFLEKYNIRYNETPGASYQDTGFWFLTFMYAERAYFVDKPYYMNRRDNENSSVYNKGKVYCVCDEFNYIFDYLSKDKKMLETFGTEYSYACFRYYQGNLERIADEYKKEFLEKWSEDFKSLQDKGLIDLKKFNEADRKMLLDIIKDPNEYYENTSVKENAFYKEIMAHKNIIIYGAGAIGKQILDTLLTMENEADVICFAVSKKEENYDTYNGIDIRDIRDLLAYRESGYIIIGTSALYQEEIKSLLLELGFKNIIAAPM